MNGDNMNRRPRRRFSAAPEAPCPARHCQVCAALESEGLAAREFLKSRMTQAVFETGDGLPEQMLLAGGIIAVSHGAVVIQRLMDDGRRQVVGFRLPGEPVVLGRPARGVTAFAAVPSTLCIVPADAVTALKQNFPGAAMRLCELALSLEDERTEHLAVLGQFTVAEKVAYFLYRLAGKIGSRAPGGVHVDLPMTREDIADYLGATSESVSRQLSRFKRDGLIALPSPDRVIVKDLPALAAEVPFQPVIEDAGGSIGGGGSFRFPPGGDEARVAARP